jgi:hypothetical protein
VVGATVVVVVVVIGAAVVVLVVVYVLPAAVTLISNSNCLDICHNRLSVVPQPICLDGIAISLNFIYYTKISIFYYKSLFLNKLK